MSPSLTRDILLHSFESASVPATFKRDAVKIPSAANNMVDSAEDGSIFRTSGK